MSAILEEMERFNDELRRAECLNIAHLLEQQEIVDKTAVLQVMAQALAMTRHRIHNGIVPGQAMGDALAYALILGGRLKAQGLI